MVVIAGYPTVFDTVADDDHQQRGQLDRWCPLDRIQAVCRARTLHLRDGARQSGLQWLLDVEVAEAGLTPPADSFLTDTRPSVNAEKSRRGIAISTHEVFFGQLPPSLRGSAARWSASRQLIPVS